MRSFTAPANPLLAAEITLGGLHGNVPEEELNLPQLSAGVSSVMPPSDNPLRSTLAELPLCGPPR